VFEKIEALNPAPVGVIFDGVKSRLVFNALVVAVLIGMRPATRVVGVGFVVAVNNPICCLNLRELRLTFHKKFLLCDLLIKV